MNTLKRILTLLVTSLFLGACSSDSEDSSETESARFKVFNAIPNSSHLYAELDSTPLTSVNYGNISSTYSLIADTYHLTINRDDPVEETLTLLDSSVSLETETTKLVALVGDIDNPQLIEFAYDYNDVESLILEEGDDSEPQFELFVANLTSSSITYDYYLAKSDESFEQAVYLSTQTANSFSEKFIQEQGEFVLYLVEAGAEEPAFESLPINLSYLDTFILIVRDNFGPSALAVDRVSGLSLTTTYLDANADATIQFYNSENQHPSIDVYLSLPLQEPIVESLAIDQLSAKQTIEHGTYVVNTTLTSQPEQSLLTNLVIELEEGTSKSLVFYNDNLGTAQAISLDKLSRPMAYQNAITLLNLSKDEENDFSFYFLTNEEDLNSAEHYIGSLAFEKSAKITLDDESYQLMVTMKDNSDNQRLIFQSDQLVLTKNTNYLFIFEADDTSTMGFKLSIIEED